jgi:hypothetical protein
MPRLVPLDEEPVAPRRRLVPLDTPRKVTSFGSKEKQRDRWAENHPLASRASVFLQGVPFVGQYADEALGYLSGRTGGNDQEEATELVRAMQAREERERPVQTAATRFAGGVAGSAPLLVTGAGMLPQGMSMVGKTATGLVAGTGVGAVEGGISGYGAGTDPDSRREGAKRGAVVGGALGGAIGATAPAFAAGVGSVANRAIDAITVGRQARQVGLSRPSYQMLSRTMQADDSLGPTGLQNLVRGGPDAMVADAGPTSRALLDASIQSSGPAARVARGAVEDRAARSAGTINQSLDSNMAPLRQTANAGFERQVDLDPLYKKAYASPIDYSDPRAMEIETLIKSGRVPKSAIDEANDAMRRQGVQSKQINAVVKPDGTIEYETLPDTRQLDYIARALGEVADQADGQGKLGGMTAKGRDYRSLQQDIRKRLRKLNPDYAEALDKAGTEIGRKQAFDYGAELLRPGVTRRDVYEFVKGLPGRAERDELVQGVRQQFDDAIANVRAAVTDQNMDARESMQAIRTLSSRATREKVEMLVGTQRAEALYKDLDRAMVAQELRAGVADNSKTYARQNIDRMVTENLEGGMVNQLREGKVVNSGRQALASVLGRSPAERQGLRDQNYEEIARFLTEKRGPDAMLALNTLSRIGQKLPANEELARLLARQSTAGVAAGAYQIGSQNRNRL